MVADQHTGTEEFNPRDVLTEIDGTTNAMVIAMEPPRIFMVALVAFVATFIALINAVPWPALIGLSTLGIPLGIWYYLMMRKRPKARTIMSHPGSYIGYSMLLMLLMQSSRFWVVSQWWEVTAKWVGVFAICWFCLSRMRTASIKNRVKDANERPF